MTDYIALVDCNSFYCSCELVFKPQLTNSPVVVLSNNDGCVVSRSDKAKALGIPMAAPFFEWREFCHKNKVHVFSSNYTLYGDMSARVMNVLGEFTPDLEIYSIDEAFLHIKGVKQAELPAFMAKIQNTVRQYTGIPVSIGVGTTKALAKVANDFAKREKAVTKGLYYLTPDIDIDTRLQTVRVQEIWGIGRVSAAKLLAHEIKTARDFKYAEPHLIRKLLTVGGARLQKEIRGESCISLDSVNEGKRNIMSTRSFGRPVTNIEELKESIANHVSNAAEKLRRQNCVTKNLSVYICTSRFKADYDYKSASVELLSASSATNKLIAAAHQIVDKLYKEGLQYKKAGVVLHDFFPKDQNQLDLFDSADSVRDTTLMDIMDKVNKKHGKNTLKFAGLGTTQFWKMLSEMRSPAYTTSWQEILKI